MADDIVKQPSRLERPSVSIGMDAQPVHPPREGGQDGGIFAQTGLPSNDIVFDESDGIETAAPDRLRPMTSVGGDHVDGNATTVSDLSVASNATLFRGPLYPSSSQANFSHKQLDNIPEKEDLQEDNPRGASFKEEVSAATADPDCLRAAKIALKNTGDGEQAIPGAFAQRDNNQARINRADHTSLKTQGTTDPAAMLEANIAGVHNEAQQAKHPQKLSNERNTSEPDKGAETAGREQDLIHDLETALLALTGSSGRIDGAANRSTKGANGEVSSPNPVDTFQGQFSQDFRPQELPSVASQGEGIPSPSVPGAFRQRPGWITSSQRVDEETGDITWDTSDPELSPPPEDSGLAEATPVTLPTETAEPVDANRVVPKGELPQRRKHNLAILLGILLLGLLLLVGLIILLVENNSNVTNPEPLERNETSVNGTMEVTWSWDLNFSVPRSTIFVIEQGMAPDNLLETTAQFQAYQWMKADPYLADYSSERQQQRFAMATFYYATNGENWKHQGGGTISIEDDTRGGEVEVFNITSKQWLSYDHHECEWYSNAEVREEVRACKSDNATVENLILGQNDLGGTLPDELVLLPSLETIDLNRNNIGGTIPTRISELTNLWKISLLRNQLTGTLPSELGLLSDTLRWIGLGINQLSGSFPTELWQLSRLWELEVGDSTISGFLPSDLGMQTTRLNTLQLARARFYGSLPTSLGLLQKLEDVKLHDNQFTGPLPSQLGLATDLTMLYVPNNLLSGTLPSELTQLERVNLEGNLNITGPVPAEWAPLKMLKLKGTSVSGTIPEELCGTSRLEFDCGPLLCGCSFCPCSNFTT